MPSERDTLSGPLPIRSDSSVAVLTGAGISAESGIHTFRDPGGIWEKYDIEKVGTLSGFLDDPDTAWRMYSELRTHALGCMPNAAHLALFALERRIEPRGRFKLITQNVDGLHERSEVRNLLPIHGSLFRTRCSNADCPLSTRPFDDDSGYLDETPNCSECSAPMRPDVVLFGEYLDPVMEQSARDAVLDCDVFIAVGTSGLVYPAAGYVALARSMGARTILVNLEEPENSAMFDELHLGKAAEILPALLDIGQDDQ